MIRSVLAILLAAVCAAASAQSFPARPLRILVPFQPGDLQLLLGEKFGMVRPEAHAAELRAALEHS